MISVKMCVNLAFDQIEKVVRLPIITPAPCLKIRCMHEGPE